ncbi:MAG TPA: 1-acyl-sn-glycerol-3-phosphate acyltransferase, partial [Spirochaetia bacterium]|nr:1-acyl-sn-glycerol-3-phosphate acyltransferase [Spirochaetia bacterium]
HQSLGDIAILVSAFPGHDLKYAAKKELKWGIPAVSTNLRLGNHAFINRKGGFNDTMRSIKKLASLPGEHICPVVFPEGTRSRTGKLGKFHAAACRVILDNSDLPVVSAAVEGGYKVQKFMDFFTKLRGLVYRIKILRVYPHVSGKQAVRDLLDHIASDIEAQLTSWRKEK